MKIIAVEKAGYPPVVEIFLSNDDLKDKYEKIPSHWLPILTIGNCETIEGWDALYVQSPNGMIEKELI